MATELRNSVPGIANAIPGNLPKVGDVFNATFEAGQPCMTHGGLRCPKARHPCGIFALPLPEWHGQICPGEVWRCEVIEVNIPVIGQKGGFIWVKPLKPLSSQKETPFRAPPLFAEIVVLGVDRKRATLDAELRDLQPSLDELEAREAELKKALQELSAKVQDKRHLKEVIEGELATLQEYRSKYEPQMVSDDLQSHEDHLTAAPDYDAPREHDERNRSDTDEEVN